VEELVDESRGLEGGDLRFELAGGKNGVPFEVEGADFRCSGAILAPGGEAPHQEKEDQQPEGTGLGMYRGRQWERPRFGRITSPARNRAGLVW